MSPLGGGQESGLQTRRERRTICTSLCPRCRGDESQSERGDALAPSSEVNRNHEIVIAMVSGNGEWVGGSGGIVNEVQIRALLYQPTSRLDYVSKTAWTLSIPSDRVPCSSVNLHAQAAMV